MSAAQERPASGRRVPLLDTRTAPLPVCGSPPRTKPRRCREAPHIARKSPPEELPHGPSQLGQRVNRYLPVNVRGEQVLFPQGNDVFRVDSSALPGFSGGIAYRNSKSMEDRAADDAGPEKGARVIGEDAGPEKGARVIG